MHYSMIPTYFETRTSVLNDVTSPKAEFEKIQIFLKLFWSTATPLFWGGYPIHESYGIYVTQIILERTFPPSWRS